MNHAPTTKTSTSEYVILLAMLSAVGAMATDVMLPALDAIGKDLDAPSDNDVHFIVTAFFLGMAVGQLIVGPLSDRFGRKPVITIGFGVFIVGCFLSMLADSWIMMLVGRVVQGAGAAAPRIVSIALVRDEFEGRAMARITSIIMTVFILIPILAPALGQGLIFLGGWKATFGSLILFAVLVTAWFQLRQRETLALPDRQSLRITNLWNGVWEVMTTRVTVGYTVAAGLVNGMFIGYLGSAQHIFQKTFGTGELFALYFALASTALGAASLLNAKLVMRFGMRRLTWVALVCLTVLSFAFWIFLTTVVGVPSLWQFLVWQLSAFFCVGIMFGNFAALSLEPVGHKAGLASAVIGSISLFISLPIAWVIGQQFDGTVYPLVIGFAVLSFSTCIVIVYTNKKRTTRSCLDVKP